jgi:hypothetical protein
MFVAIAIRNTDEKYCRKKLYIKDRDPREVGLYKRGLEVVSTSESIAGDKSKN